MQIHNFHQCAARASVETILASVPTHTSQSPLRVAVLGLRLTTTDAPNEFNSGAKLKVVTELVSHNILQVSIYHYGLSFVFTCSDVAGGLCR